MAEAQWVSKLNKLAMEMDEQAASIHPSAWNEALSPLREKYIKLAKTPTDDDDTGHGDN